MPADLVWRSGELRSARRLELMNLRVDRKWDWRMRFVSHGAIIVGMVFYATIAFGAPWLLWATVPVGAVVLALEMRRLQRDKKELGVVIDIDIAGKRRRRAAVLAVSVAVFVIGLFANTLPSQELHDEYWFLFVAPSMIAFMVGAVALLMLGWSYLPRRDDATTDSP
ncbi:MAG: hypothetical protein ABR613_08185 [Actinomycetota bacterium]